MLGTGLIGDFYTQSLQGQRNRDRVEAVYSRSEERAEASCERWQVPASAQPAWTSPTVNSRRSRE